MIPAFTASLIPSTVSWSVRAMADNPISRAWSTNSDGVRVPSENVE